MIARLCGRIVDEPEPGTLVLDVHGVGYEVLVPLGTRGRLTESAEAVLHVHTHVREDALTLFGFATTREREAFRVLLGVASVGPRLALSVLGALDLEELSRAVARGDAKQLVAIPGVGKKTAERLVLELRDKLPAPVGAPERPPGRTGAAPGPSSKAELLTGALTRMGFRPGEVERAVAGLEASGELEAGALPDLIRSALGLLAR